MFLGFYFVFSLNSEPLEGQRLCGAGLWVAEAGRGLALGFLHTCLCLVAHDLIY